MFQKTGNVFTIIDSNRIKKASDWTDFIDDTEKKSSIENIAIHKNLDPSNIQKIVCDIDLANYVYIHTTIMASVNLESNSDYYITRETEKYINTNGDAWPREQLIKDYESFKTAAVYVEHDQNPERAKGKVLDAIARDMQDTILIDLLFCVDRKHEDLVHNIETGIANAVSMGCTTKYTICSICGNVAHDDKEYCIHVKKMKNQMVRCEDGIYRKACELCFDSNFYDCSVVANPAFAGAVFRKLVASDQLSTQLFSNLLCKKLSSSDFQNEIIKIASKTGFENTILSQTNIVTEMHPIERPDNKLYEYGDGLQDIPFNDRYNIKEYFDEQQPEGKKLIDIGKKKKATIERCADFGKVVFLTKRHTIQPDDRKTAQILNFVNENAVGRIVAKKSNSCAIYFPKIGLIKNIPLDIISYLPKQNIEKSASKINNQELMIRREGIYLPTNDKFQIYKVNEDSIEVRWLDGRKSGVKEKLMKKDLNDKVIKLANCKKLATFESIWNGSYYQLKCANWNEKYSNILDELEPHIDNVQHDITTVIPRSQCKKYSKSFCIQTKIACNTLRFNSNINNNKLTIHVESTEL